MNKQKVIVAIITLLIAIVCALSASSFIDALRGHENSVKEILALIDSGDVEDASVLLDSLHAAIINTRAKITGGFFSGQADLLTDPFLLPAGVYRVHFTTEGFGIVETVVLDGPDRDHHLFNVFRGAASEGVSTFYKSQGSRIMVQFSNISAPFKLVFERIE